MEVAPELEVDFDVLGKGPWIRIAGLFERLIEEKDGAISGLKLVESVEISTVDVATQQEGAPKYLVQAVSIPVNLLVVLDGIPESGIEFWVDVRRPNDEVDRRIDPLRITAEPPLYRASIKGPVSLSIDPDHAGMTYFDIYIDGNLVSTIPLHVVAGISSDIDSGERSDDL